MRRNVSGASTSPQARHASQNGIPYAGNPKMYHNGSTRVETGKGYYQHNTAYSKPRYAQRFLGF